MTYIAVYKHIPFSNAEVIVSGWRWLTIISTSISAVVLYIRAYKKQQYIELEKEITFNEERIEKTEKGKTNNVNIINQYNRNDHTKVVYIHDSYRQEGFGTLAYQYKKYVKNNEEIVYHEKNLHQRFTIWLRKTWNTTIKWWRKYRLQRKYYIVEIRKNSMYDNNDQIFIIVKERKNKEYAIVYKIPNMYSSKVNALAVYNKEENITVGKIDIQKFKEIREKSKTLSTDELINKIEKYNINPNNAEQDDINIIKVMDSYCSKYGYIHPFTRRQLLENIILRYTENCSYFINALKKCNHFNRYNLNNKETKIKNMNDLLAAYDNDNMMNHMLHKYAPIDSIKYYRDIWKKHVKSHKKDGYTTDKDNKDFNNLMFSWLFATAKVEGRKFKEMELNVIPYSDNKTVNTKLIIDEESEGNNNDNK